MIDRFTGNHRIEPIEAMRGFVEWLAKPRPLLLVSIDCADVRNFKCLVPALRLRGRAHIVAAEDALLVVV